MKWMRGHRSGVRTMAVMVLVLVGGLLMVPAVIGNQQSGMASPGDTSSSTGLLPPAAATTNNNTTNQTVSFTERWKFTTDDERMSNPLITRGTVYFGGRDLTGPLIDEGKTRNWVYALAEATGDVQWKYAIGNDTHIKQPKFYRNTIYASARHGVYALNAETGAKRWGKGGGGTQLQVVNGTVYVSSGYRRNGARTFARDAITGDVKWTFLIRGKRLSAPVVADGTVYVGSRNGSNYGTPNASYSGTVYALDAATGDVRWSYNTHDFQVQRLQVANGTVYASTLEVIINKGAGDTIEQDEIRREGEVFALDAATGAIRWNVSIDSPVQGPVVVDDTVYFTKKGNTTYAVKATTGETRWTFPLPHHRTGAPEVAVDHVFVKSGHTVYVLDADTGAKRGTISRDGRIVAGPTVARGTLYMAVKTERWNSTTMYALTASGLTETDSASTPETVTTPTQTSSGPVDATPTSTQFQSPSPDSQSGGEDTQETVTPSVTPATTAPGFGLGVAVLAATLVGCLIARRRR